MNVIPFAASLSRFTWVLLVLLIPAAEYSGAQPAELEKSTVLKVGNDKVRAISFSPSGKSLATGAGKEVVIWDIVKHKKRSTFKQATTVGELAFANSGSLVVVLQGYAAFWMQVIDPISGKQILPRGALRICNGYPREEHAFTFRPGYKTVLVLTKKGEVSFWDISGKLLSFNQFVRIGKGKLEDMKFRAVDYARSGKCMVIGLDDGEVIHVDGRPTSAKPLKTKHKANVSAAAYSPTGRTFATASEDGQILLWQANVNRTRSTLDGHNRSVSILKFSPKGKSLASASAYRVKLWNVRTGKIRALAQFDTRVNDMAFSPGGSLLAVAHGDQVTLFKVPR